MRGMTLLVVGACALSLAAGCDALNEDRGSTPTVPPTSSTAPQSTTSQSTTSQTPEPDKFDHAAVQDAVHKVLTANYGLQNVRVVICPANQLVRAGTKFRCTATIDGERKKIPIKVTSDDGDYTVGHPE